ncbi:MAG: hypothetical protein WD558_08195 [Pseudomonadales bacterium]
MNIRIRVLTGAFPVALALGGCHSAATENHSLPDLSGTYDIATLTPLQRPEMYGDKLLLSPGEAKKIAMQDAAAKEARSQASDPNRQAPPAGGDGSQGAAGNVGGYNTFWIDDGDSVVEVDGKFRTSIITDPPNGRIPPMLPEAQAALSKRFAAFRRGNTGQAWWVHVGDGSGPYDNMEQRGTGERCLLGFGSTGGPPMLPVLYNNLKRIVQTDDHVMILVEMVHDARIIRLNSEHLPPHMKRWLGDSIGWWEGDTLVVDTTNFHPHAGYRGSSENLHVIERFRKLADGNLLYSFTVDDPTVWTASWRGEYTWPRSDDKVFEYACHEGNYALGGIMRGARLLEAEAMQARQESGE